MHAVYPGRPPCVPPARRRPGRPLRRRAEDGCAARARRDAAPASRSTRASCADLELIATGAASPLDRLPGPGRLRRACSAGAAARRRHGLAAAAHAGGATSDASAPSAPGARGRPARRHRPPLGRDRRRARSSSATRSRSRARSTGPRTPRIPASPYLLARPRTLVGGPVTVLPLPDRPALRRAPPDAARAARARSPSAAGGTWPASRPATRSTARTSTSPSWRWSWPTAS